MKTVKVIPKIDRQLNRVMLFFTTKICWACAGIPIYGSIAGVKRRAMTNAALRGCRLTIMHRKRLRRRS